MTTARRATALPDVPTVAESGLPGFNISTWYGLWAPRGTPVTIVVKLATHVAAAARRAAAVRRHGRGAGRVLASGFCPVQRRRRKEVGGDREALGSQGDQ
ncbi:tripartite tricarboxylate transporter substrate-binding protein [Cupriavidus yeoncheonensis]|uniref:tripartite tricarboxylate transporter substrate-binding protein n=1 Tax=Cupriavidus yeoncheonensis TaxID=1462994 RepID=UPI003B84A814